MRFFSPSPRRGDASSERLARAGVRLARVERANGWLEGDDRMSDRGVFLFVFIRTRWV